MNFESVFTEARIAAVEAGLKCRPVPMVVQERINALDDKSAVKQEWFVDDGVCGFAWVKIRPGNSSFARWLVKNGKARSAYTGGVDIWVSEFGQSMQRKEAFAVAMAKVFREKLGVNAYADSRLD